MYNATLIKNQTSLTTDGFTLRITNYSMTTVMHVYTAVATCPSNQFKCLSSGRPGLGSGGTSSTKVQCIPQWQKCDSIDDCIDGSDEIDCGIHPTSSNIVITYLQSSSFFFTCFLFYILITYALKTKKPKKPLKNSIKRRWLFSFIHLTFAACSTINYTTTDR